VATAIVTTPVRGLLWTVNILLFSALLQLGLLLPMAETFHRVTYAGIGLNALAIPVMTALLAIAVPVVILAAVAPALAVWPAKVLALVLHLLFVLTGLPHLPAWLSYRTPGPPNWVAYSFAVSMVAAACTLGRARKAFKLSLAAVACFVLLVSLYPFAPGLPRGVLELAALDCGGGSVLFVVLPDRTTMLFDAGVARGSRLSESEGLFERQRWDRGEDIISPYLWSRGLKKVDVLVLATGHDEQSLSAVMENFRVGELWYAHTSSTMPASDPSALYRLHGEAHQRGALLREMAAGDSFSRGGALIQILWPPAPAERPVLRASDESPLAMRISTAGGSVLLPGGITGNEEQELVLTSSAVALKSKVLAVGRSGAKLASTPPFLARVRPELAIVSGESLGAASRPSPETLERLQAVGASVLRTDLVGTVTIQMRSGSFSVHCFARPCGN
jgi:competence protein ComEC